ncbi:MAG: hypothetical protein L0209_04495 [candidate division Zixibacteria bacterium]|nr:hypothetical protein [candidate division Zixibacteria bacterium]
MPAGLLVCACAGALVRSSLHEKFSKQQERWESELDSIRNAAYLIRFNASGPKGKGSGSLEVYWLAGDTVILFSPGLFGRGSLRGRWVLGESFLVYFPRDKSYYKGSWEDFLLGIKSQTLAVDSLIFGILSRRAFLTGTDSLAPEQKEGNWVLGDRLGSWDRHFIFNRRGWLSRMSWKLGLLAVRAEAEMSHKPPAVPLVKRLEWEYFMQEAKAAFEVERMVTNAEIPASKKKFKVPGDAVQLEKIEINEER